MREESSPLFLGSMLPQYMALPVSQFRHKKNLGHFEARYEVEIRYADCSHKYIWHDLFLCDK